MIDWFVKANQMISKERKKIENQYIYFIASTYIIFTLCLGCKCWFCSLALRLGCSTILRYLNLIISISIALMIRIVEIIGMKTDTSTWNECITSSTITGPIHVESICNRMFIVCSCTLCVCICLCVCTCTLYSFAASKSIRLPDLWVSINCWNSDKRNQRRLSQWSHFMWRKKNHTHQVSSIFFNTSDWLRKLQRFFLFEIFNFRSKWFFLLSISSQFNWFFFLASLNTQTLHGNFLCIRW